MTRAQSDAFASAVRATIAQQGWGLWAVEVQGGASFIGCVGLNRPKFEAHFMPAIEVGWRLAPPPVLGIGIATGAGPRRGRVRIR